MRELSKDEVDSVLEYDPAHGRFRWRVARGCCKAGDEAGCDSGRGYIFIRVNGVIAYAHRLAFLLMTGEVPPFVDHINGDRADNRWENLRAATRSENGQNMARSSANRSGVIGVFWNVSKNKWTAKIKINQRTQHLGHFDSIAEATEARRLAERDLGFHANHGRAGR